jgi:uncharacterized membrane protein YoaK (UPF0700 family)
MFRHQGPGRTDRQNRLLAGYLAFFGGFVNLAGFVLIGTFTSHVTGGVGRLANDVASSDLDGAAGAVFLIVAFFTGALVVGMTLESDALARMPFAYGAALSGEAALLLLFTAAAAWAPAVHTRTRDVEAALLCVAMGMQNALVTRLSGAVVRTTHLTGVVTDLGIEVARWFRWWRVTLAKRLRVRLSFGRNSAERPPHVKIALLATIASAFTLGAIAGACTAVALGHAAMLVPAAGVAASAAYAFGTGRTAS